LEERIFLHPRFFSLFLEICFREEISEDLLEMLLAHLIFCSLSVMHSARLRKVREKKADPGWDGMAKWFFIGMHILVVVRNKRTRHLMYVWF
jgi:hypothetical protein